jgi:hypothetical protein
MARPKSVESKKFASKSNGLVPARAVSLDVLLDELLYALAGFRARESSRKGAGVGIQFVAVA